MVSFLSLFLMDKYNMKDLHKVLFSHDRGTEIPVFGAPRSTGSRPGRRGWPLRAGGQAGSGMA